MGYRTELKGGGEYDYLRRERKWRGKKPKVRADAKRSHNKRERKENKTALLEEI